MTRHEEVERAARAIHENYCACLALSGRDANERRCDLGRALSRRDDEKAVAWCLQDRRGELSDCQFVEEHAIRGAEWYNSQERRHRLTNGPYRVVPLYTRPEGHDAGAGKCGTKVEKLGPGCEKCKQRGWFQATPISEKYRCPFCPTGDKATGEVE